jgi:hypothetical protein
VAKRIRAIARDRRLALPSVFDHRPSLDADTPGLADDTTGLP